MKSRGICFSTFLLGILLCVSFTAKAQDYTWWNAKHNWDGVTHWTRYLILSPAYLGPNALPVPSLRSGRIDTAFVWKTAAELHRSNGDHTEDILASAHIPFAQGLAALKLEMVVWEHYKMDTATRDERRARDKNGEGYSIGDLLISSCFQITKNRKGIPDMNIGMHIRTATGSNMSGARFSDSPGYYFDLAMSKRFQAKQQTKLWIEPYAMLGFYAWQVNRDDNLQNDAFMYGFGTRIGEQQWQVSTEWSGYHGYFNNGDRPMVLRTIGLLKLSSTAWISLRVQQGLHDFAYTSFRFGFLIKPRAFLK